MRTRLWTMLLGTTLALALPGVSGAQVVRHGVGGTETIECRGQAVEVNGTSYDLTLLGDCPVVEVNGASNTVRIQEARRIELNGMGNKVIWERGPNGGQPSIKSAGLGNSTRQGRVVPPGDTAATGAGQATATEAPSQPAPAAAPRAARASAVVILENRRTEAIACAGNDVTVNGNHCKLTLTGECRSVTVNGNYNVLSVEAAEVISALGNSNRISWDRRAGGKAPKLVNLGNRNDISRTSE